MNKKSVDQGGRQLGLVPVWEKSEPHSNVRQKIIKKHTEATKVNESNFV